jgi:hypothetical protein
MDLPLFAGSPIQQDLMIKYLELRFPEDAPALTAKLQQPDLAGVVSTLIQIIQSAPMNVSPEQRQQIDAIVQNATQVLGAAGVPAGAQPMAGVNGDPNTAPQPAPQGA